MAELLQYSLCNSCLGCGRLENENFTGVCRCENYVSDKKAKTTQDSKKVSKAIDEIHTILGMNEKPIQLEIENHETNTKLTM